jgi:hypothetical protein
MKSHQVFGLVAGLAVAVTAASVQAEPGKGAEKKAQAMQIMIDKQTGRKVIPDDSDAGAGTLDAATTGSAYSRESYSIGTNEHGTEGAFVGAEHHQALVMTIDENGKRHIEHKSHAEVEAGDLKVEADQRGHQ